MSVRTEAQILGGQSTFMRQLDAVNVNVNGNINYSFRHLDLNITNRNNTRYFLFNGEPQNVQREHNATFEFKYALLQNLSLTTNARTFTFTNTGLRQDIGLIGLAYYHPAIGTLNPSIGYMRDQRSDLDDSGFAWALKTDFNSFDFGDTRLDPILNAEVSYIDPRRFVTTRFGTRARYSFEDIFDMRSELWFGNARRDSYQATSLLNRADSNFLESIDNDTTYASVSVNFPVLQQLRARVDIFGLNNVRKVSNAPLDESSDVILFDSRSLRQHLDVTTTISYPSRTYNLNVGFIWSAQVRESRLMNTAGLPPDQVRRRSEILENSNFTQSRFEFFTNNQIQLTPSYRVGLDFATSILRYDTPEINKDNRDEFTALFRFRNDLRISDQLLASVVLAGEAFHYVYLFSERSIENNWRRSIRLLPELVWTPNEYFTMRNTFMVRANYTVEDYVLPGRPKTDQSAREMAFFTNTSYEFAPDWTIRVEASRSELRIGKLYWETFQETPIDTLVTYDIQPTLQKRYGQITVATGIRYFRKLDFLQRATAQIEVMQNGAPNRITRIGTGQQITTQIGPVVTIGLPFQSRNELFITGWYQIQRNWQRLYIEYPEEHKDAFLRAERQATRRVFPNFEMVARFGF